jgi:tRNA threonylcarbamoyladenosine biosynthesis protein TsaE
MLNLQPMQWNVGLKELNRFAEEFWKVVGTDKLFAFEGEMGAGKTTTIAAICHAKGVKEHVSSPTFSIINEYRYSEGKQEKKIFHIDLYRLKDEEDILQTGVDDCISSGEICFVEWPQKAPALLAGAVKVNIRANEDETRTIRITKPSSSKENRKL